MKFNKHSAFNVVEKTKKKNYFGYKFRNSIGLKESVQWSNLLCFDNVIEQNKPKLIISRKLLTFPIFPYKIRKYY